MTHAKRRASKGKKPPDLADGLLVSALRILRDLMLGGRHSRHTVAATGVSLPTADRWLVALRIVPGIRMVKVGRTTWLEWERS